MSEEVWKPVPNLRGYEVSSHGRVRSYRRRGSAEPYYDDEPVILTPCLVGGRYAVTMQRRKVFVHRLVLESFVGPCPPGMVGCHNDGDHANNRLDNLRWDTQKSNCLDRKLHGREGTRKLSRDNVIGILHCIHRQHMSKRAVAELYGVSYATVCHILTGLRNFDFVAGTEYEPMVRARMAA